MRRRAFIGSILYPLGATALSGCRLSARSASVAAELASHPGTPEELARDEAFWAHAQAAFTVDRSIVNLNNGGVSPSPAVVQEAMARHLAHANAVPPPISLWQDQQPQREVVRSRLARRWGVDPEEIAITRNASESLQICQLGIDLEPGDEVLTTTHDYPRMVNTFKQRERRDRIKLVQFKLPVPAEDEGAIVSLFERHVTPRTRMILVSHIVNITGQILPVRAIVEMARRKNGGIPVIVDGAHALGHFEFSIADLGCDYYGVSLHKWLFAPHGTGLLYVRRDKIKGLWPMMAAAESQADDIRKFEEIGTHPEANALAIAEALTFHDSLVGARKEARLRYLREYWQSRLLASGRARLNTSRDPRWSCGIVNIGFEGLDTAALADFLWKGPAGKGRDILTVAIVHDEFNGLRVTPSVYTTLDELDRFAERVEHALRHGLG